MVFSIKLNLPVIIAKVKICAIAQRKDYVKFGSVPLENNLRILPIPSGCSGIREGFTNIELLGYLTKN